MDTIKLIVSIFAAALCLVDMYYFHKAHESWDSDDMIYYWINMVFFFIMLVWWCQ